MASEQNQSGANSGASHDQIDRLFGGASPNTNRQGCPSPSVLHALAQKQRPLGDPAYDHLASCSPCYQEFRRLQTGNRLWSWRVAYAAVATTVFLLGSSAVYLRNNQALMRASRPGTTTTTPARPIETLATVDLRHFSQTRGFASTAAGTPVQLTGGLLSLKLLLPLGSEPGRYRVAIVRSSKQTIASAEGQAAIIDFVTTLSASLDLRNVVPGLYDLEVMRSGEQPEYFAAEIR